MEYMVIGADGKEYGPTTLDTLKQWAAESRIVPFSTLRDFATGNVMRASDLPGLFVTTPVESAVVDPVPPAMSAYPRVPMAQPVSTDDGKRDIFSAIFRSVLALVFFFFLHGIGVIFAGYGVYYAYRAQQKGHKYGAVALGIAIVTLLVIILGYALRFSR